MSITLKPPIGGKLVKGRDHKLICTITWEDGTPLNLSTDVKGYYLTVKPSDALDDDEATIALNSFDNPDQFTIIDDENGQLSVWIKKTDQDDIIPNTEKYCFDMVVVLTDETEWQYILDYNVIFAQPVTRSITSET